MQIALVSFLCLDIPWLFVGWLRILCDCIKLMFMDKLQEPFAYGIISLFVQQRDEVK